MPNALKSRKSSSTKKKKRKTREPSNDDEDDHELGKSENDTPSIERITVTESQEPQPSVSNENGKKNASFPIQAPSQTTDSSKPTPSPLHEPKQDPMEELLPHCIEFSDGIHKNKKSHGPTVQDPSRKGFVRSVHVLVEYLEQAQADEKQLQQEQQQNEMTNPNPTTTKDQLLGRSMKETIAHLFFPWVVSQLQFLQGAPPSPATSSVITTTTKASTAPILQQELDRPFLYRCFHISLRTLLPVGSLTETSRQSHSSWSSHLKNGNLSVVSAILTQSTLAKLIPPLLEYALQAPIHSEKIATKASVKETQTARQLYSALLSFRDSVHESILFRPTLEKALGSLVVPLADSMSIGLTAGVSLEETSLSTDMSLSLTVTTLQWLHTTVLPRGNPKTTFHLLVQPSILAALSKLYYADPYRNGQNKDNMFPPNALKSSSGILPLDKNQTDNRSFASSDSNNTVSCWIHKMVAHGMVSCHHHLEGLLGILLQRRRRRQQEGPQNQDVATDKDYPLETNKAFRSYQEELVALLESGFLWPKESSTAQDENMNTDTMVVTQKQILACIRFLPVVWQEFLIQFDLLKLSKHGQHVQKKQRTDASSSSALTSSANAFEFFQLMATPLLCLLNNEDDHTLDRVIALEALSQLTRLLFVHNVYIASQDDAMQSQTHFLESIVTSLLEVQPRHPRMVDQGNASIPTKTPSEESALAHSIGTLKHLLQLNHHLLHSRLVPVLSMVCSFSVPTNPVHRDDDHPTNPASDMAVDFFVGLVDTYQKLRQSTSLVHSVLQVMSSLSSTSQKHGDGSKALLWLLRRANVQMAWSSAMHHSPSSEIQTLLETLSQWFSQTASLDDKIGDGPLDASMENNEENEKTKSSEKANNEGALDDTLDLATEFTVSLLQSVPVNQTTASSVSELVMKFNRSVVAPLSAHQSATSVNASALKLCAWLIRLQEQCAFWLGRQHELLEIPPGVQDQVRSACNRCKKETKDVHTFDSEPDKEALVLLVSHRMEQIALLLHNEQLAQVHADETISHESHDKSGRQTSLEKEGRDLAALLTSMAGNDKEASSDGSLPSGWMSIAPCAHVWTAYATDEALNNFLSHVLKALSREAISEQSKIEQKVAMNLVTDIAFLDNQRVGSILFQIALNCAIDWMAEAYALDKGKWADSLASLSRRSQGSLLDVDVFEKEMENCKLDHKKADASLTFNAILSDTARLLQFTNGLPSSLLEAGDVALSLCTTAWLEWVILSNIGKTKVDTFNRSSMMLASPIRSLLEKTLALYTSRKWESHSTANTSTGDFLEGQFTYLNYMLSSTQQLLSLNDREESHEGMKDFMMASESLLDKLWCHLIRMIAIDQDGSGNHLGRVVNMAEVEQKISSPRRSSSSKRPNLIMGLLTIKSLLSGAERARASFLGKDRDKQSGFLLNLWHQCWKSFGSLTSRFAFGLTHKELSRMVLGDLVRWMKHWGIREEGALIRLQDLVKKNLKELDTGDNAQARHTLHYGLACLVQINPSPSQVAMILDELTKETNDKRSKSLLEATFCQLLKDLESTDCYMAVQRCLSLRRDSKSPKSLSVSLRVFTLVMKLKENDSSVITQVVKDKSQEILSLALHPLYPFRQNESCDHVARNVALWQDHVQEANHLLCALIRRKDVLVLQEKDLAIILSYLNLVLSGKALEEKKEDTSDVSTPVFVSCSRTLLLLLQRCAKQLYACVPLVISVLHSFWISSMTNMMDKTDIALCGNELCRLSEALVPHREVYKKHVIPLLLDFVRRLDQQSLLVKNALLPSVYCLLDLLTIHEQRQLNALMDTTSKSNFRSIYQTYQKLFAYKGQ